MIIGKKIIHYEEIDSTNDEAKRLIKNGLGEGTVVIADAQIKGRGKPGSGWFSPAGYGIYLSAIIKPYKNPKDLAPVTLLGAKAAVAAIEKRTGLKAEIKIPNDVIVNDKKICGVLVERVASGHLVIGIGVNINNPAGSFPEDIKDSASSLKIESNKNIDLQKFVGTLVSELDQEYLAYLSGI